MKKVIFIGKTGSGKTTLSQMINKMDLEYKKTQAVEFYDNIIDTPGEYIENRVYYRALIITAAEADVIALVNDCTQEEGYIPPNFASIFSKEVIGIITKIDLAKDKEQIRRAREQLKAAGATKIFEISSVKNIGIEDMLNYLR